MNNSLDNISDHGCDTEVGQEPTIVLGRHCLQLENESPVDRSQTSSTDITPTKRRSRSRKLIPAVEGDKVIAERFRTKVCRNYLQHPDRPCPYEDRCMFAHGDHELRTAAQNLADGLISEDEIREFKRTEADRSESPSLGRSSSMSVITIPFDLCSTPPQGVIHEPMFDTDPHWTSVPLSVVASLSQSSHRGLILPHSKSEDHVRVSLRDGNTPASAIHQSSMHNVTSTPPHSANAYHGSLVPRRYPQSVHFSVRPEGLTIPATLTTIGHKETTSGSLVPGITSTYRHDPYSWRVV